MKILQIGKFYPIRGGVEKVMWDLSGGLNSRGIHCDMLCAMLPSDTIDEADVPRARTEGHLRTIAFPGSGTCFCVKAYAKVAATMISPAMIAWLRRHKAEYDIIHIHHPDPMACLALRLSGYKGKVILHWHSDILKQKGLLKFYMPLQRWLIRRADRIVGTTPVYVVSSKALASAGDKLTYIPIGIEDNIRFAGNARTEGGAVRTIFSMGRLVPYKGFCHLIDAAKYLPADYRIVIGGEGPLHGELQQRIDALDSPCKVELAGYLSNEEAREMFNSCDLFVLPSVMKTEAFGIVQLEAMSCAKPVIATRIPGSGTSWVNEDGVSGINVPCADPKAIADAIMDICSDPATYGDYCRCARKRYEEMFTLDRMIDKAIELYESCLR